MTTNGTIECIRDDLFRIRVPLPGTPLGNLNAYVIRSSRRNLIIDTGLDHEVCRNVLLHALDALEVDLARTDVLLTHHHADHIGLVPDLLTETSTLYCHRLGWESLRRWEGFAPCIAFAEMHGFPTGYLKEGMAEHSGNRFRLNWQVVPLFVKDGDTIAIGDYRMICKETPGHSADHLCLYEPKHRLLFSGDHILGDISPNIQNWEDAGNPLKDFLQSLVKTGELDVSLVLPAHREFVMDHRHRIQELIDHHHRRIDEIMRKLQKKSETAYGLASKMTWDIRADGWENYPIEQKWFATLEVLAHLRYLESDGRIGKKQTKQYIYFGVEYV